MGIGGATWGTAGTLELGSGNTFDNSGAGADYDVSGLPLHNPGWWKFTPTASHLGTILIDPNGALYSGDEDNPQDVAVVDFVGDATLYQLQAGVEYHLVVGQFFDPGPATYVVTYAIQTVLAATPWSTTFQDADDNFLIISEGDLLAENHDGFDTWQDFYDEVIEVDGATHSKGRVLQGRFGDYYVQEVLGGEDPIDAETCCWAHATWGQVGHQLWNSTGDVSGDPTPPVCDLTFPLGPAGDASNDGPARRIDYLPGDDLVSATMQVREQMQMRALWFIAVRDGLIDHGANWQRGTLSMDLADPVADGVPAAFVDSAVLEWEDELELVKVELAGDRIGRDADDATVTFWFNEGHLPFIEDFGDWSDWLYGNDFHLGDLTGRPFLEFDYRDGDPDWVEYEGVASWEDCQDFDGSLPDATVGLRIADRPDVDELIGTGSDIAVQFTFRSPRYRWVYEGPTTIPPRRIFGRSDGTTHGARRGLGGGNTRQAGNRTLGSIL